jgi:hypothetical protein
MWRRVDLGWTNVSEKRIASIFKVEKSVSEEPAWVGGWSHIPEDGILYSHLRENLKSYMIICLIARCMICGAAEQELHSMNLNKKDCMWSTHLDSSPHLLGTTGKTREPSRHDLPHYLLGTCTSPTTRRIQNFLVLVSLPHWFMFVRIAFLAHAPVPQPDGYRHSWFGLISTLVYVCSHCLLGTRRLAITSPTTRRIEKFLVLVSFPHWLMLFVRIAFLVHTPVPQPDGYRRSWFGSHFRIGLCCLYGMDMKVTASEKGLIK